MPSNETETNNINGSRLTEQGPSSGRCSRQGKIGHHHENPVISKRRKWTSQENKIVMECYLLSEPKIRGYRKHMLSLWLQKGMFQGVNQKIIIGSIRLQLGKQALACPNVAGGSGGHSEPPLPQQGCYGAEPPRKNFKALNCIWIDLN